MTATTAALGAPTVRVSVVVPTCDRLHLLNRCVDALLSQTLAPCEYEVIIVDEAPNYLTRQLATMWSAGAAVRGLSMRYVPGYGIRGPTAARNRGWRLARGAIVAFTTDDAIPLPSWLSEALAIFNDQTDAVIGQTEIPIPAQPTEHERDARLLEGAQFSMANCFIRTSALAALNGFDERFECRLRGDSDLLFRLLDISARMARAPRAVVIHPVAPAPWGVSLLQAHGTAYDALLYKKHPQRYRQKLRSGLGWNDYATVAALLLAPAGQLAGAPVVAGASAATWLCMTCWLCMRRLHGTSRRAPHVAEMILTSLLVPPLAVFWRIAGTIRFQRGFA